MFFCILLTSIVFAREPRFGDPGESRHVPSCNWEQITRCTAGAQSAIIQALGEIGKVSAQLETTTRIKNSLDKKASQILHVQTSLQFNLEQAQLELDFLNRASDPSARYLSLQAKALDLPLRSTRWQETDRTQRTQRLERFRVALLNSTIELKPDITLSENKIQELDRLLAGYRNAEASFRQQLQHAQSMQQSGCHDHFCP